MDNKKKSISPRSKNNNSRKENKQRTLTFKEE